MKYDWMEGSGGEDLSDYGDCGEETGGEEDLMAVALHNSEITAQLAAAGPAGLAAAAAIVSTKKRKRPHVFETNPSIRKRQHNRLLRKLSYTIDELATRVGQQAVVVVATPGKPNGAFKCFGAKPLEDVIKNLRTAILSELETALSEQAPAPAQEDPSLYELPPLVIDGIPTPVEKMTQAQLRAFIPLMLKFSTGNGKPGWGRESTKPPWWPQDLPWANVRMDARTCDEKQKTSWTHALRQIVINCYKYHGREDLLPAFNDSSTEDIEHHDMKRIKLSPNQHSPLHGHQTLKELSAGLMGLSEDDEAKYAQGGGLPYILSEDPKSEVTPLAYAISNYLKLSKRNTYTNVSGSEMVPTAVLQTITNPDGTVSIIQVDPNNPIITLPDGTTAHVQGVATIHAGDGDGSGEGETVTVDLNSVTEDHDGQIILQGEDGTGYPVSVSGMITVPGSMYQTVVANIQAGGDGTIQVVTPAMMGMAGDVEVDRSKTHQIVVSTGDGPQVLQVLSLKDTSQKGID